MDKYLEVSAIRLIFTISPWNMSLFLAELAADTSLGVSSGADIKFASWFCILQILGGVGCGRQPRRRTNF